MAISASISWSNEEESLEFSLGSDTEGYNPDIADDIGRQLCRWLKESINDPTVVTPRTPTADELVGTVDADEDSEE